MNHPDFQILALEVNRDREKADAFIAEHNLDFIFGTSDRVFVKEYFNTGGFPNSFLIDREGKIVKHKQGFTPGDEVELKEIITKALK